MPAPKGNQYAKGCETSGRPKKYTAEYLAEEAIIFSSWIETHIADTVFWFRDYAIERGYDPARLAEFEKDSEEFALVIKRARAIQESKLAKGSLENKLNNATAIFLLKSMHGHKDKFEVSGDKENPIAVIIRGDDAKL